jgi:retron-type reverse transcriptase
VAKLLDVIISHWPAMFSVQQVAKYFTSRGSSVFVTAVDASKAFDRIDHFTLLDKLISRRLPVCFIKVISCWYSKLFSSVRWNSVYSDEFKVVSGVRQGGILSPILFNVYVDDMIVNLRCNGDGCHVGSCFIGCVMYADDLLLYLLPFLVCRRCWTYVASMVSPITFCLIQ